MIQHLLILPVLLPLLAACACLLAPERIAIRRLIVLLANGLLAAVAAVLVWWADSGLIWNYMLGSWPAPFGIALLLDRLSALLLLTTALLANVCYVYAWARDWDKRGSHFHAFWLLQLMGLNGAFLTGDLFNLFVFFEVLLAASYGLLIHGDGELRVRWGLSYVALNLAGSALFLIAASLFYGTLGSLNLADLAQRIAAADPDSWALLRVAGMLLFVVFALKAALLPLHLWLPGAYGAASGPVAALFAVMTKVGVYAIVRVYSLLFGVEANGLSDLLAPWLLPLTLATVLLAALMALAGRNLRRLNGALVLGSVGMLLLGVALHHTDSLAATLFYLPHSTLAVAFLYLFADWLQARRGAVGDGFAPGPRLPVHNLGGVAFLLAAMMVAGLPPFGGFLAKAWMLQSPTASGWVWGIVLLASALTLVALARAGSLLFWHLSEHETPASDEEQTAAEWVPMLALLCLLVVISFGAGPLGDYCRRAAEQLRDPAQYWHSQQQGGEGRHGA